MGVERQKKNSNRSSIDNLGHNLDGVNKADEGQYHEALHSFSKAIESEPGYFVSYFNRASVKMLLGDIEGARNDFQKSSNLAPEDSIYT